MHNERDATQKPTQQKVKAKWRNGCNAVQGLAMHCYALLWLAMDPHELLSTHAGCTVLQWVLVDPPGSLGIGCPLFGMDSYALCGIIRVAVVLFGSDMIVWLAMFFVLISLTTHGFLRATLGSIGWLWKASSDNQQL